jgi:hypothetical protein
MFSEQEFVYLRTRLDALESKLNRLIAAVTAGATFLPGTAGPEDADALDLLGGDTRGGICLDEEAAAVKGGAP